MRSGAHLPTVGSQGNIHPAQTTYFLRVKSASAQPTPPENLVHLFLHHFKALHKILNPSYTTFKKSQDWNIVWRQWSADYLDLTKKGKLGAGGVEGSGGLLCFCTQSAVKKKWFGGAISLLRLLLLVCTQGPSREEQCRCSPQSDLQATV